MLINQNGSVVPHVNPGAVADHKTVHTTALFAWNCADKGAIHKLDTILEDCWSKGLSMYQTINICSVNGYALCIAEPRRKIIWDRWDTSWAAHCAENEDLDPYRDRPDLQQF